MGSRNLASTPVAILAGGLATRLGPITQSIPKSMVPIGGRPFLEHQLEYLRGQGVRRVVICAGHLGRQIEAHFGKGRRWGIRIDYSFDGRKLLGTAGALKRALPLLGHQFLVMYGDSWLPTRFDAVLDAFDHSCASSLMTVFRNQDRWDRSNVWFEDGRILAYDKRNRIEEMQHIDYGLSVLRADALDRVPPGEACDLASLLTINLPAGFEVSERFYEIGSPMGLQELRRVFQ